MNHGTVRLEEARKYIKKHWLEYTDSQLSEGLELSLVSIRRLRYRLGLIRAIKKNKI